MKQIKINYSVFKDLKRILNQFSSYKEFSKSKEFAFKYSKLLGVNVCPYCNINYTYTIQSGFKFILRPDFDHFEPKSKNIGKSYFIKNLIPSCQTCNSRLKLAKICNSQTHLNPFIKDFDSIIEFDINLNSSQITDENSFEIILVDRPNIAIFDSIIAKGNIELFKLNERYQFHKNIVLDIFKKADFYRKNKLMEIERMGLGPKLHEVLFLSDSNIDIGQISLGKLRRDIVRKYS